ncbi:MAG: helix-turn-helix domain-containing protein [Oscillospiraceae bacterium]|nr:helix-turn-helix domain-containing protein [Oscillospiraceae bacterium]
MLERNIAYLRKKQGVSVSELAAAAGVVRQMIYDYESGKKMPQPYTLLAIAEKLGTTCDAMLKYDLAKTGTNETTNN